MYKLVVFAALLACATAAPGLIGGYAAAPIASWGGLAHGYASAPILSAPIIKTAAVPVATSYSNSVRLASPAVAVAHAPVVAAHGPYLAAPAYAHAW